MRFNVVIEPSDEGGYTVYVPSLRGCISEGDTVEVALANIHEAIEVYLEPVEDDWVMEENALVQEIELRAKCPACITTEYQSITDGWLDGCAPTGAAISASKRGLETRCSS